MSANQTVQSANNDAATTDEVMRRFNDVFQLHDPSALNELVAENCVVEKRSQRRMALGMWGATHASRLWTGIATAPGTHFDLENVIVTGDSAYFVALLLG